MKRMKRKLATFTRTHAMLLTILLGLVVASNFQSAGASSVEGIITNDTVWTLTESPYKVLSDVTIANGANLTIEPGVEVLFETGSSLIINGSLHAVGTSINRITFTSNKSEPVAGDWNGIKFYGDENGTLTMGFCDVEYAKDGITAEGLGGAVIEKSTIVNNSQSGIHVVGTTSLLARENTIEHNANGISSSGVTCSGLKIVDNYISNNENGVYLFVYGDDSRIHTVTIFGNTLKDNANGIFLHSSARPGTHANAYINSIKISDNMVRSSKYGIYLLAQGWGEPGLMGGGAYIYNSIISDNTISFSKNALYIDSSSEWYSWISNLTISRNIIHSGDNGIFMHAFRAPQPPYQPSPFDVILVGNTLSANNKGVKILGDVSANFSENSVSYNSYGIHMVSSFPCENLARNNDIYQNTVYGFYIEGVLVDAEYNYWGASSGPYHETLNPFGEGNRVNGDGENLDFTPFLNGSFDVVNDPPLAVLLAGKTIVEVNQTVTFDGSQSSDDSSIIKYFFDFGDGETMQVFSGVVSHEYSSFGTYNVSLVVMDDLGVNSTNRADRIITVASLPSLVVDVFLSPISVVSEGETTVEVSVEVQAGDEVERIEGALIELASDQGGNFDPSSGYTGSSGEFESTFSAPSISESIILRIVATASKEGYEDGSDEVMLQVLKLPPGGIRLDPPWNWFAAIVAAIMVAVIVYAVMKRRVTTRRVRKPKHSSIQHASP